MKENERLIKYENFLNSFYSNEEPVSLEIKIRYDVDAPIDDDEPIFWIDLAFTIRKEKDKDAKFLGVWRRLIIDGVYVDYPLAGIRDLISNVCAVKNRITQLDFNTSTALDTTLELLEKIHNRLAEYCRVVSLEDDKKATFEILNLVEKVMKTNVVSNFSVKLNDRESIQEIVKAGLIKKEIEFRARFNGFYDELTKRGENNKFEIEEI